MYLDICVLGPTGECHPYLVREILQPEWIGLTLYFGHNVDLKQETNVARDKQNVGIDFQQA